MTRVVFNGAVRYLLYSVGVMMDVNKQFGGLDSLLEKLDADPVTPESFEAFSWIFARMVNEGERKIAQDGYEPLCAIAPDEVETTISLIDHARLVQAILDEIEIAYNHEYTDEEKKEIDLGLAEIRKKKESPVRAQTRIITTSD